MPVNINGSTGVTTPSLASTAMPTSGGDPVVESGSNSDGEWTRWADGTQLTSKNRHVLSYSNNALLSGLWTYPAAFVDTPVIAPSWLGFSMPSSDIGGSTVIPDSPSASSSNIQAHSNNLYSSGETADSTVIAKGNWK